MDTYKIIRFFKDNRDSEIVDTGLTLEEAQAHCRLGTTHGDDWFEGYEKE